MDKNKKMLLILVCAAIVIFVVLQFFVAPAIERNHQANAIQQNDALTHDYTVIKEYESPYIGDAANVTQLFYALPLNQTTMSFEIDSENCTLTVYYDESTQNIGQEKVRRDLIYNSAASMAAIDNLTTVTYKFSDTQYSFTRTELEQVLGHPLSDLLTKDKWKSKVQDQLTSDEFVALFY